MGRGPGVNVKVIQGTERARAGKPFTFAQHLPRPIITHLLLEPLEVGAPGPILQVKRLLKTFPDHSLLPVSLSLSSVLNFSP